jgi:hypothetical protein
MQDEQDAQPQAEVRDPGSDEVGSRSVHPTRAGRLSVSATEILEILAGMCFTIAIIIVLSDERLIKHRLLLWIGVAFTLISAILLVVTLIRRGLDFRVPDQQARHAERDSTIR